MITRQTRVYTVSQTINANVIASRSQNVGSPPRDNVWIIEAATLTCSLAMSADQSQVPAGQPVNRFSLVCTPSSGVPAAMSYVERWRDGAVLPLQRPVVVRASDTLSLTLIQANNSGSQQQMTWTLFLQLLQADVDDGPDQLIPDEFTVALQI